MHFFGITKLKTYFGYTSDLSRSHFARIKFLPRDIFGFRANFGLIRRTQWSKGEALAEQERIYRPR